MSIFSLANLAAESVHHAGGHPHFLKTNSTFSSVIGSTTSFIIGTGSTANIFSSSIQAITNLQEMLRLVYNGDPHGGVSNWLLNFFVYGSGGGQTVYIFGARKVLNYRLSHNFTVDRYHKTLGLAGAALDDGYGLSDRMADAHSHIHDVTWTPIGESDKLRHMILPILFSLSLLAWDLVIVWKFKIASTTLGASKDLDGKANLHPSHAGMLMITLLEVFEEGMIQVMEIIERCLCTAHGAVNFARSIEENIDALSKKVIDVAAAKVRAEAIALAQIPLDAALLAAQQAKDTVQEALIKDQIKALPSTVNTVKSPLSGMQKFAAAI